MPVVATSSAALALDGAALLIAKSLNFQQRGKWQSSDEARPHIYLTERTGEIDQLLIPELMPMALLTTDDHGWKQIAQGTQNHLLAYGAVHLLIADLARFADIAGGANPRDSEIDFVNFAFGVIDDVVANVGLDDGNDNFFPFNKIDLLDYMRSDVDRRPNEDFWCAGFVFRFDAGGSL